MSSTTNSIVNLIDDMPPEPKNNSRGSNEFTLVSEADDGRVNSRKVLELCKQKLKNVFRKKILRKRFPILDWLPRYTSEDAAGDIVAGITVGLTIIPQALAYSGIAGLDPEFGLYSSFMGCFVYIFLGSCKDIPMGPTAIAALLTFHATNGVWQRAVLLSFLSGILALSMGLFGLGFLIDFVSGPVGSGFTSAVSLIILSSQVKDIFGIRASGATFVEMWSSILKNIRKARMADSVLGCTCIVVILLMRLLTKIQIGPSDDELKSRNQRIFNKIIWLIATARNAILVVATGCISYYLYENGESYFHLIGTVPAGLPHLQLPPFSIPELRNETSGEIIREAETFSQMLSDMGSSIIVVPLIALLEDIAVCKAFANGKPVDATQELIAIGVSNMANSFVQGYPISGAVSRGAVNHASGVRTPFGSFYTGMLVVLALLFLTPYFFYIPKAALAAIIIAAVVFMIEVKVIKPMWRSKKSDLIPGLSAFLACLVLPIQYGILVGIAINIIFILYHAARPKMRIEYLVSTLGVKFLMVTPDRCLIFPSVDYVRNLINKQGLKSKTAVVIDCSHIYGADFTAAKVIEMLINDFNDRGQQLIFYNLKPSIGQVFAEVGTGLKVCYDFDAIQEAIGKEI